MQNIPIIIIKSWKMNWKNNVVYLINSTCVSFFRNNTVAESAQIRINWVGDDSNIYSVILLDNLGVLD